LNNENIDISKLELASNKRRLRAFIIDDFLITFVMLLLLWEPILNTEGDYFAIAMLMNKAYIQIITIKIIYQSFFIWYYGATLGKLFTKIKVIDFDNFGRVSFAQSVLRASGRILSESFFYLGFMLAYYTKSKQTFHDKIAKTLVVNEVN
jgi:uncharacterized RDD family membrane protein YckC